MADAIYGWIKNLAFYFIFITVVLNFLPDSQYRSYVKAFLGMLLLLVVCQPLFSLFGLGDVLAEHLQVRSIQGELRELEEQAQILQTEADEYYLEAVLQEVESQVETAAEAQGLAVEDVRAEMKNDGGGLRLLAVTVRGSPQAAEAFQEEMMQIYGLSAAQVQITRLMQE